MLRVFIAALLSAAIDVPSLHTHAAQPPAHDKPAAQPETPEQAYLVALRQAVGAPARADLGDQASVRLTGGMMVVPKDPAARLLTLKDQPVPPDFVALLVGSDGIDAPGIIRFVRDGFIDSDAALAWTPDDFLASLNDTVQRGNEVRANEQQEEREARRWILPPRYDPEAHQLSWSALIVPKSAPRGADGEITVHAIGFGREGYIDLSVVTSVEKADEVGRDVDAFMRGLSFIPGKAYADAQPDDRRAPYALPGAMGLDAIHRARPASSFGAADMIVQLTGSAMAGIGTLALVFRILRHMRREARRG